MKYESIKHSFLVILIATTTVGCAGNSVQPPAAQYSSTLNGELIDSPYDTSSIDVEDVDKDEMAKQESENSPANLGKKVCAIIFTTAVVTGLVAAVVTAPAEVAIFTIVLLMGGR
jgi:hypothetical protein